MPSNKVLKNSLTDIQLQYYLANSDFARYATTTDAVFEIKHDVMSLLQSLMFPALIVGSNNTNSKIKSNLGVAINSSSKTVMWKLIKWQ